MARVTKIVIMDSMTGEEIEEDQTKSPTIELDGVRYNLDLKVGSPAYKQLMAMIDKAEKPTRSNVRNINSAKSANSNSAAKVTNQPTTFSNRLSRVRNCGVKS